MTLDERAARTARRQYSLLSRQQALAIGFTPKQIRGRLLRGVWSEMRRGIYVVGGGPPSWQQTLFAVTLGAESWIAYGTASKLLRLPFAPEIGGIEIVQHYGTHRETPGIISHRSRVITSADITRHERIPVTSVGRTIVDCSGRLDAKQVGKMIDEAQRRRPRSLEETRAAFARVASGGNRRLRSVREALGSRLPGYDPGESDLELWALHALVAGGLPMPVQQLRVVLNGKRRRIDLAYPSWRIAIELQSWEWHKGRFVFDDDHAKANELTASGWRHLGVTSTTSDDDLVRWVTKTIELAA